MLKKIKKYSSNALIRNVLTLVSGTAIAHAITLIFTPIITRLYGPEEYGYLGVFTSAVYLIAPFVSLTLPMAIVIAKTEKKAEQIFKASITLNFLICIAITLILLSSKDFILTLLNAEKLSSVYLLIPVSIFSAGLFHSLEQWQIRKGKFKTLAQSLSLRSLFIGSSQSTLGIFNPQGYVLIGLYSLALIAQSGFLLYSSKISNPLRQKISTSIDILKEFREFPVFRAPQVLLNSFALSLPTMLFASLYGSKIAGLYVIAFNILNMPIILIGKSVGDAFYPELAKKHNENKEIHSTILKATKGLIALGIIPFSIIAALGPWLFSVAFGDAWQQSGAFAQWMSVWLFLILISRPAVAAISVLNLQKFLLFYEIITIVLRVGAIYLGVIQGDAILSIAYLSITNVLCYGFVMIYVYIKAKNKSSIQN